MPKDKSTDPERKEKKEKKEKKRKHSEAAVEDNDGIEVVSEKKKHKEKKRKATDGPALDADGDVIVDSTGGALAIKDESDDEKEEKKAVDTPLLALVPFANPLCDEKSQKKVLKSVKKGTAPPSNRSLRQHH